MVRNSEEKKSPAGEITHHPQPWFLIISSCFFFQRVVRNWHDLPRLCAPNFPSFNLPNPFKRKTATIKKKQQMIQCQFLFFFLFLFFTFRTGNIRREYMSKKENHGKSRIETLYCSTNVNKSRGLLARRTARLVVVLIEVKRREKPKRVGVNSRVYNKVHNNRR